MVTREVPLPKLKPRFSLVGTKRGCIGLLALVVVFGLLLSGLLIPKSLNVRSADEAQAAQITSQLPSDNVQIARGRYVEAHLSSERSRLAALAAAIPPAIDYRGIIAAVLGAAVRTGTKVTSEISNTSSAGNGMTAILLTIGASGPPSHLIAYTNALEHERRLLAVSGAQYNFTLDTAAITATAYASSPPPPRVKSGS